MGVQVKQNRCSSSPEYAVITDNKIRLDGNIPQKYKVEGLRVKGLYQVSGDGASYHMWGKAVNFLEFENE